MARIRPRLTFANVVSLIALFVALGGSATAAILVTGKTVKDSSLTGKDVKNSSLTGSDLKNNSVGSVDVKDGNLLLKDFKPGQLVAGAPGPIGPQGPKGDAGATGATGDKGDKGDPGPSQSFFYSRDNSPIQIDGGSVGSLNVPVAGDYVINAKLLMDQDGAAVNVTCSLDVNGSARDRVWAELGAFGDAAAEYENAPLQTAATLTAGSSVSVTCSDGVGNVEADHVKITATQVGALTSSGA